MSDINSWLQEAIQHHGNGDTVTAKELYYKILEQLPDNFEAHFLLGTLYLDSGNMEKAESFLETAISLRPEHVETYNNLAIVFITQSCFERAAECLKQAINYKPDYYDAHFNLGIALQQLGKYKEAIESYQTTTRYEPNHEKAYYNMGVIYHDHQNLNEALKCYTRAVSIKPDYVLAINNLGDVFQKIEKFTEAVACYSKAILLKPDFAEAHYNLGIVYQAIGDWEKAIGGYKNAILHKCDYAEAYYNLGNVYNEQWMLDDAVTCFIKAINLKPGYAEAHNNLGEALQRQGKLDEAITNYGLAFTCKPDYLEAAFNQSIAMLLKGDLKNGWKEYEQRLLIKKYNKREFRQPKWDGRELHGERLLVHAEQGFGDTFQFVRYLPIIKALGGHVVFECQKGLAHLFKRCNGFDEIIEKTSEGGGEPESDFFIPLMSLPNIFGTTVDNIPANIPYIWADPELINKWKVKIESFTDNDNMPDKKTLKVGLVWAGKSDRKYDKVRSCPLSIFTPLGDIPDIKLFSLQKGVGSEQVTKLAEKFPIVNLENELDLNLKFADTAAVIANLDLVISVDSAVAHLAGALGKPTWTLIPYAHDWRWLRNRDDSPWYPGMRLFRQTKPMDWEGVVKRLRDALLK